MARLVEQGREQAADLVAGQRDQLVGGLGAVAFGGGETARNAWASMARTVQRCQEVQRRTWCSSRRGQPLAAWNDLLDLPAGAGDADQLGQRDRARVSAAVERQLAGAPVAADQQPVLGRAGRRVVDVSISAQS